MTKMKSYRLPALDQLRLNKLTGATSFNETKIIQLAVRYYYNHVTADFNLPDEDALIRELVSKLEP